MDRRTFLEGVGSSAVAVPGLEEPFNVAFGGVSDASTTAGTAVIGPEITDIRYPLTFVPSIREPGERLRVELAADVENPTAFLRPQVGSARPRTELEPVATRRGDSEIWQDAEVQVIEYEVPKLRGDLVETSYDLIVEHEAGSDAQCGAVDLVRNFPETPTIVVIADPHIASGGYDDPEHAARSGENMVFFSAEQVLGTEPRSRWAEIQRLVAEINLLDPDFILTAGDYFSVQDYPGKFYMEYKDGHRIYSQLNAPTYTTIGNHDGYIMSSIDGIELYERFVAPEYYSLEIRPGLRLFSANTYDWSATDRMGASYAVSAWGGQVRNEQLAWLRRDLGAWRDAHPDGDIIGIGHHTPAAPLDARGELAAAADGIPLAEQSTRAADSEFRQGGQYWYGKNRLPFRDLLADVDVTAFFTGHTHRDLLSRYHDGNVVTTTETTLEYRHRDDSVDDTYETAELRDILRDPNHGPLFVETTTSSDATGQYIGYRSITLETDGVNPADWGSYPADEDESTRAADASTHADLGLYSRPTFELDAEITTQSTDRVELTLTNDLVTAVPGATIVSLRDCPAVRINGGQRVWRRRHEDTQDIKVSYTVPARSTRTITVECRGQTPTNPRMP